MGQSSPTLPPSDSLTQYYSSDPSPSKPALCDLLHSHPDAFELSHHGNPRLPDDFRVVYYYINGLDGFKHAELLAFMSLANVDCLVLIDARVSKINSPHYLRETRAELGPGAVCLVSSPTAPFLSTDGHESIKIGGNVNILNDRRGPSLVHLKSDPSGLCVADEAVLKSCHGRLKIIATYWPFPSGLPIDDTDGRLRKGLFHRLSVYLKSVKSSKTPL